MPAIANTSIQIKKSGSTGNTPADLNYGEIALNYADGKIFYKNWLNSIDYITNQDTFNTVNANSTLLIATSSTDVLTITPGSGISIDANSTTKSVVITATGNATTASVYANGAFGQANAAYAIANSLSNTLTSISYTTANTNQVVIDSFSTSEFRSAKYDIQLTSNSNYHVFEVKVLHDNSSAFLTQYGEIFTDIRLGNIDASCSGGYLNLLFQPNSAQTQVKLFRTIIPV